ncbi:uncharacterized protein LOC131874438 [Cryptomeria japonica]|uniref:uncharacterized protein LOC131874438 n=1 Tax=Cryptomeria japonica TaxID=3369 RepID=UPI0027DA1D63|nr:uncharacterized protein LOC131874438 [Cryptomeria japonica]
MSTWKACWLQVLEICGVSTMLRGYPVQVVGSALKLLAAQGKSFITEFSDFSRELLWLRCDDCPYTSIPSHFSMQKLRVLELLKGSCQLDTLWQSHKQAPTLLRELSVHHLKSFPESIGLLKHLEKILLRAGLMETLPDELYSFNQLIQLQYLSLYFCDCLMISSDIPRNIRMLEYLDYTSIRVESVNF